MASTKANGKHAKANKGRQDANEYAIGEQFKSHKSALLKELKALGTSKETEDSALEIRRRASLAVVNHAYAVGNECEEAKIDRVTASKGFRAEIKAMLPQLAKVKWPYVKVKEMADGSTGYELTGYGNNMLSISVGVIENNIDPAECIPEGKDAPTYVEVRKRVEAARRDQRPPEERQLADAREVLTAAVNAIRKAANSTDPDLIVENAKRIDTLRTEFEAEANAQRELEEKAAEKKAKEQAKAQEIAAQAA